MGLEIFQPLTKGKKEMSYSIRIYSNSGYNSTNIPDSPALLNNAVYFDLPALDILQDRFLSTIKVKATWDQVKDADYCRLTTGNNTWFYSVDGVTMLASDVAELSVTPDFINSVGGVSALTILDGITERVHTGSDDYGEYCETDPLMIPTEPLDIVTEWIDFTGDATGETTFIESTVNPKVTAESLGSAHFSYNDPVTGTDYEVDVPKLVYNEHITVYEIPVISNDSKENGTCLYIISTGSTAMTEALAVLRSLGVEQSIINQFTIPNGLVTITQQPDTSSYTKPDGGSIAYTYVEKMQGKNILETPGNTDFNYQLYNDVQNNRLNYSNICKYGIISCTGESAEFEPADIYETGVMSPEIRCITDPHPDGKPYFRFKTVNQNGTPLDFWRNCVSGMTWKQVPLIYNRPSGSVLNALKFQNSQAIADAEYTAQMVGNMANAVGGINQIGISALGGMHATSAGMVADVPGMTPGILSGANQISGSGINALATTMLHNAKRKSELSNLVVNNSVAVPTVNFPFNSEVMRDYLGNGILLYRYKYSLKDKQRIDKLLTMYGYKYSKALEKTDFTNRVNFNFVMCNNITIGGFAKWINDGIAEQLKAGVRVWHVTPNTNLYTNNPIAV